MCAVLNHLLSWFAPKHLSFWGPPLWRQTCLSGLLSDLPSSPHTSPRFPAGHTNTAVFPAWDLSYPCPTFGGRISASPCPLLQVLCKPSPEVVDSLIFSRTFSFLSCKGPAPAPPPLGPLSSNTLSQVSEAAHLTWARFLGLSWLASLGHTQQHFQLLSVTLPAGLGCLFCCVLPSRLPTRCSTPFSRLCLSHTVTHSPVHMPLPARLLSCEPRHPVLPAPPSVTFHVPLKLFHTILTLSWGTLPDSLSSSLHHSTVTFSLLPRCHTF